MAQPWGEVLPRWLPAFGGRGVPIAVADLGWRSRSAAADDYYRRRGVCSPCGQW